MSSNPTVQESIQVMRDALLTRIQRPESRNAAVALMAATGEDLRKAFKPDGNPVGEKT